MNCGASCVVSLCYVYVVTFCCVDLVFCCFVVMFCCVVVSLCCVDLVTVLCCARL